MGAQPLALRLVKLSAQPAGLLFARRRIYSFSELGHARAKALDFCRKVDHFPIDLVGRTSDVLAFGSDPWLIGRRYTGNITRISQSPLGGAAGEDDAVDLKAVAALKGAEGRGEVGLVGGSREGADRPPAQSALRQGIANGMQIGRPERRTDGALDFNDGFRGAGAKVQVRHDLSL